MCPAKCDIFHAEGQKRMTKLLVCFRIRFRGHASRLIPLFASVLAWLNINCSSVTPTRSGLADVRVFTLMSKIFKCFN